MSRFGWRDMYDLHSELSEINNYEADFDNEETFLRYSKKDK